MREPDEHFDGLNYAQSIKEYVWTREIFETQRGGSWNWKTNKGCLYFVVSAAL